MVFKKGFMTSIRLSILALFPLSSISCGWSENLFVGDVFTSYTEMELHHKGGTEITDYRAEDLIITRELQRDDVTMSAKENHFFIVVTMSISHSKNDLVTIYLEDIGKSDGYVFDIGENDSGPLLLMGFEYDLDNEQTPRQFEPYGDINVEATRFVANTADALVVEDKISIVREVSMKNGQDNSDYTLDVFHENFTLEDGVIGYIDLTGNHRLYYKSDNFNKIDSYKVK